jgi:uncharacterized coiled-coil protein SlyX
VILAMASTGWPLAGLITAVSGFVAISVVVVKVGDKAGRFEEHLNSQDKAIEEQAQTLAKQDDVLDRQNAALAALQAKLDALHDRDQH